ncbi:sugar ABC transporter substrate-binding protein [Desulfitibacter alkalitolerans]|uniref:sugar ABC transporter substrate-binding protein n=1 Tax=Desulfitibacter alkalitolerans TaxID=264641 RepID=UPI00048A2115|nr:substrate-binding domain-containing protein [Desulfitibacter alkalitolerans]
MKLRMVFIGLLCLIIFSACNQGPQQKPSLPEGKIGVIFTLMEEDIAQIMKKTMEEEARKQNVVLAVVEMAPTQEELRQKVDEMLQEDIDAAIIQFGPGKGSREIATKIMEEGIKLISMGTMPEQVPLDGHVTPDFVRIGQLQGSFISTSLKQTQGEVVIYTFDTDAVAFAEMVDGAAAELEEAQIKYTVKYLSPDDIEGAADAIARDLSQNFNIIGAIFPSSLLALKGVEALDAVGRDPQVITLGLGANKDAAEAIKQGLHDGEVDYMPQMLARNAVIAAAQLIKNDQWDSDETLKNGNFDVPAAIIPVRLITQENTYLLDERLKLIEGQENSSSNQNNQGNPQSSGSGPMSLTIETKEGRQVQVQIPKPIANLEVGPKEDGEQTPLMLTIETVEGQTIEMEIPGEIVTLQLQQAEKE